MENNKAGTGKKINDLAITVIAGKQKEKEKVVIAFRLY